MNARAPIRAALTTLTAAAALTTGVTPATAHTASGTVSSNCDVPWITCSEGDLWLFYNSKSLAIQNGSIVSAYATFYGNVHDYYGSSQYQGSTLVTYRYVFDSATNGHGQYVKNNAASVWNCSGQDNYRVYYNSGYGGTSQFFRHRDPYEDCVHTDLISALKNENASQHFA
ncbi:hypothetical protein [Streptomyces sp. SA15]|uniref:hypothetical protein n=1 Tax=Streptomyces sp. SA15 TaxID=934019 RepID=UPI0015C6FADF|nr:hypothetical protein [Streptomyces sp. SA15]